jgi:hypothetical protein
MLPGTRLLLRVFSKIHRFAHIDRRSMAQVVDGDLLKGMS